ncbi:hypothetical protein M8J76_006567 [Diaphorina citri]|nr:hypothetical protein M8J76_006567 [Diaphorina citri]
MTSLTEELQEFNELCRVCANKTNILLALNIFEGDGSNRAIYKKINECLPIKVQMEDKLPKLICEECVYKLDLLNEFRDISSKTEVFLTNLLNRIFVTAEQNAQVMLGPGPSCPSLVPINMNEVLNSEDKLHEPSSMGGNQLNDVNPTIDNTHKTFSHRNTFDAHCADSHWDKCEPCGLLFTSQEAYAVHCTEIHSKQPTSEPSQDVNYILSHMETYRQMPQQTIPVTPVLSNGVLVGALTNGITNGVPVNSDDGNKGGDAQSKSSVVKSDLIKDPIASDDNMEDGYMDEPDTDINPKEVIDTGKPESKSLYKCDRCPKKFSSLAKYNFHVSNHGVDKPFQCFKCEKRFRSKLGLDEHEAKHTGRYEYECNACGKGFQNKSYLIVHQRVHSTDKPYACKTCPRSFKTKQTLLDHENRHMGVKPYSCEICGRGFITKGLCKSHQKIHSGNDNRQYPCPVCKKLFVSKSYLNTHLRIHTGDKPFVCEHCNKGFLTKVDLKIHNTMHTGEKSFVCETCGKAFARRDALRCHTRSHTGERPYRCNICGQSFTQFSPMAIHKRLHTGERPYSYCSGKDTAAAPNAPKPRPFPCDICGKAFMFKSNLRVHHKKHKTDFKDNPLEKVDFQNETARNNLRSPNPDSGTHTLTIGVLQLGEKSDPLHLVDVTENELIPVNESIPGPVNLIDDDLETIGTASVLSLQPKEN